MISANNQSRKVFSSLADEGRIEKEKNSKRNVLVLKGHKYSFSCSSRAHIVECRQTYEDCSGFICKTPDGKYWKYESPYIFSGQTPSRISPKGVKAYSITRYTVECAQIYL